MSAEQHFGEDTNRISLLKQIRWGLSSSYYRMAQVLGLKRLQDFMQASSTLPESSSPLWLLGNKYQNSRTDTGGLEQEVWSAIMSDLFSRIWITYRQAFAPIAGTDWTTDVGWGCTLRTGQMMLAQALLQHLVGRQWRRPLDSVCPAEVAQVLHWFVDDPAPQHAFSIHNLCAAGQGKGIIPGQWLGPWTCCHALHALVSKVQPGGLFTYIAASSGGGAPVLYATRVADTLENGPGSSSDAVQVAHLESRGLLLLVPLVLGTGKTLNARYIPQLQEVLTFTQSAGIVGGRPGSSLYFVGCQDDNVLFLDPHTLQQVVSTEADLGTYFCSELRCMPLSNIDPSLAIGFYCRDTGDFADLCHKLSQLEQRSGGAPLLCVVEGEGEPDWAVDSADVDSPSGLSSPSGSLASPHQRSDWEFL